VSSFGSGPASGAMGLHPSPVGTPDELRRENLNIALVGSCASPSPGVRGCQYYVNCIFRFRRYGGFRDQGPKNVGYYLQTQEGRRKEDQGSCHWFMSRLYDRMRAGIRDREDGKNGEIIQVIEQEGGVIHRQVTVNANAEIPNAAPKWEPHVFTGPVTAFPRPSERTAITYHALLEDRRRARELEDDSQLIGAAEPIAEPIIPVEPLQRVTGKPEEPAFMDLETATATSSTPTEPWPADPSAEPESREIEGPVGRRRPR